MRNEVQNNGIAIVRTPTGIGVAATLPFDCKDRHPLRVEVRHAGRMYKTDTIDPHAPPWRDYYHGIDMLQCEVAVKAGDVTLAELPVENAPYAFMVRQGEQQHITEHYVSVPPALLITDERGDTWTLGLKTAEAEDSPRGEFAFEVMRNGIGVNEIASRIERRNGRVRIFTRTGWKVWNGGNFF